MPVKRNTDGERRVGGGGGGGGGGKGGKISETSPSGLSRSVEVLLRVTNVKQGPLLLPFS